MTVHPRLIGLGTAVPPHVVRQEDAKRLAANLFSETLGNDPRLIQVFDNAAIGKRHACMPLDWFGVDHGFAEKNALYIEHAVNLAEEAARLALAGAGLAPRDVDHVVFVSSTGIATPSIDAILANRLGFRTTLRRTPVWGLGCAGGAVGLSRARDFALADPSARVLMIALELCSLTFQRNDVSKRNLVAASLFGDGAAAVVVTGAGARVTGTGAHRLLELVASQSILWKDSLDVMGWEVDGNGLHVVFSRDIPAIVRDKVRPSLAAFLDRCGLRLDQIDHVVAHPGGVKVLSAYAEALELPPSAFDHSRAVLRDYGNMSSPSCLFVLERFLASGEIGAGERAVVAALGPGFSAEYVLATGGAA
jgi:alkylresorcinol/alkylpyrone synthase